MDNAEQEHDRQLVEEEHRRKGAREKSGSQLRKLHRWGWRRSESGCF